MKFIILRFIIGFCILAGILNLQGNPNQRKAIITDAMHQFDAQTQQIPVLSHGQLDSILSQIKQINYNQLPSHYITATESNRMELGLQSRNYYVVKGAEIYRYIVDHFRIADLLSKDTFYKMNLDSLPAGTEQYWLADPDELHAFLDLILFMKKNNYNDSAITINHGHRNPAYNKKVGGVTLSYHQKGVAIDLKVGDINRDGTADKKDKQILLDELENHIIQNKGGLGLYPNSDVIHFDTRGYRARWNSHK